jgi:hypothetical protein
MELRQPSVYRVAVSLADATRRYKQAARVILNAYAERGPAASDSVTPGQLHAAIEKFLADSGRLEHAAGDAGWIDGPNVTELGDYGITLLMDLAAWAHELGLRDTDAEFDHVALAFAEWIARHGGEIRTLDPVVDALARLANRAHEKRDLESLIEQMTRIVHATATSARLNHGKRHPSEPWRLLHFNRGVVATRTHNPAIMQRVFDELAHDLPGEAPQFFAEGMQQLDKHSYPLAVHEVMTRYFDRWTRPRMH